MKKLKLDHKLALLVLAGQKTSTWRLYDDKDLTVNDQLELVDKVSADKPETWRGIGTATITSVIEKRLGNVAEADMEGHERFVSPAEMLRTYREYYGPNVSMETLVKIVHFNFKPKLGDTAGTAEQSTTPPALRVTAVKLYADGGSRGNPGPSASGFVILNMDNKVLVDKGVYLGVTTNNQAEYTALKLGLEEAHAMGAHSIEVYMDSMLVVNQMKGVFKVRNRDLWPLHDAIKRLVATFQHISFTHVPRELNKLADAAVNRALDEELGITPSQHPNKN